LRPRRLPFAAFVPILPLPFDCFDFAVGRHTRTNAPHDTSVPKRVSLAPCSGPSRRGPTSTCAGEKRHDRDPASAPGASPQALKLPTFLREYDRVARQCAAEGTDFPRFLLRLAELELIDRERRMVERRIKAAKFPTVKSLDSFDFAALPSLNKVLVMELARSEYVERRENIIALGTHPGMATKAQQK
jgi:IstB-like ATP binding protein